MQIIQDILKENFLTAILFNIATYTPYSVDELHKAFTSCKSIDTIILATNIAPLHGISLQEAVAKRQKN